MCKIGDIIVINNYITNDDVNICRHSFAVVSDKKGTIASLDYDIVASVISSFKSKEHKLNKIMYK